MGFAGKMPGIVVLVLTYLLIGNTELLEAITPHPQVFQSGGGCARKTSAELHDWIFRGMF